MGTDEKVTIGLIGYGYWGPNLCRNFLGLPGARLEYVCDSSDDKLREAADKCPGAKFVKDPAEVLADESVDAVVVASSAVTHHQLALEAMRAGKHVFVEKPMSLEVAQGQELVDASEELGKVLMVGHLLIYHPAVDFLKAYVESGELGDILYIYSHRLNLGRLRHDENCLWSLAPHDISLMLFLLDSEPVTVVASGASYLRDGLEDVVFCSMQFPGGQMGNCHVSWLDPHKIRKFTIVGTEKMAVFDDMSEDEKIKIFDKRVYRPGGMLEYGKELYLHVGEESVPDIAMQEPLRRECQHFIDCVRDGVTPRSDGVQGLQVLKVLTAASESLAAGGVPVRI
ncbi:MAG TPA: Gfo/Idh/MocA family oxidoreductase [Candidatus Anoxymicrobiaceae bacterium]